MAQINITCDVQTAATLDRIAANKGISRPELLRSAIREMIEAHDAGRLAFQSDAGPKLDASVSSLVHQLRSLVIELDRAQADNAKLIGALIKDWNGGEEANRLAQQQLSSTMMKHNTLAFDPFVQKVGEVLATMDALPPKLASSLETHLARITEQLDANNTLARVPRRQFAIVLGDDRALSLRFLSACAAITLVAGMLLGFMVPGLFERFALSQAGHLIDSPARMCRLIERQYGTADCKLPDAERDLGIRVIAHERGQ